MCRLIHEFIKSGNGNGGYGYFSGDKVAIKFSVDITRSQIRKFKRHGVIPINFLRYLEDTGAIERNRLAPEKKRTIPWLLDLLWETPDRNQADRSEGECIRAEILKDMMPWLRKSMGSSQQMWDLFRREGQQHGLKGPGGTAKLPDYLLETKHALENKGGDMKMK